MNRWRKRLGCQLPETYGTAEAWRETNVFKVHIREDKRLL
jgi:hypothetical protein